MQTLLAFLSILNI